MKSNSDHQNENNIQPSASYEQENKLLRELYLERMRINKKQQKQHVMQNDKQQHSIQPTIKQMKQNSLTKSKDNTNDNIQDKGCNILLNTLYFDTRQIKPSCFIKIFSLLNQDVYNPKKTVSQNVEAIFITTFGFQVETFEHLLTSSNAKLVILNDSDEKGQNKVIKQYSGFKNFTVVLQAKKHTHAYGVSHTKLWIVKFKTFLRVVVCTSNQHTMDWAVWQNAFWYQDFPLKTIKQNKNQQPQGNKNEQFNFNKDFYNTLNQVVESMIPKKQLEQLTSIKLQNYLFENIKVILIPSIPGRHHDANMKRQGICKIKQVMRIFNKINDPILTYNSTSLGVIQRKFIQQLYLSFCPNKQSLKIDKFRLIYPTRRYIEEQTGGQAQVLFLTSQNYKKSDLGKTIFFKYDTNPQNPILGNIPHLKTVLIQPTNNKNKQEKGILYVGSHNMTKAAWGKLQKQNSQIYIANSQLGLIFLDVDLNWYKKWSPFKHPPQPYKEKDEPFLRDNFKK